MSRTPFVFAWLLAMAACGRTAGDSLKPGDTFPAIAGVPAGEGLRVVWVLRPEDYLKCATGADQVRRFQRRYGSGVPLTVLYVGEHPEWGRAFLIRHRVNGSMIVVDRRRFERTFRGRRGSGVHLLEGTRVRKVVMLADTSELIEKLEPTIEPLLAGRGGRDSFNFINIKELR
ncbi:hypothetical protein [Longimicrobium sp.]|jgi:hypothetical protein|uniref:hypothetical protein n=1 Tax=Longimicrobium sp. TaxID=2029185 RepID=UPI002F9310E3